MSFMLFRRQVITLSCILNPQFPFKVCSYSSNPCQSSEFFVADSKPRSAENFDCGVYHLSPLCRDSKDSLKNFNIELVDNETWRVSSALAEAWKKPSFSKQDEIDDGPINHIENDPDFDEIEDMRIRGNLFYKLDKESKEYEEYKLEFHRRSKNKNNNGNDAPKEMEKSSNALASRVKKSLSNGLDEKRQNEKEKFISDKSSNGVERPMVVDMNNIRDYQLDEFGASPTKRTRTPTYNQLTAPYHEPFCLDIYVSKGSIRASIIHRATCKVVAVAHSISKDMKFDLGSTKNRATCAAVGEVLAQRALADDIHNVVYTPRKGEKLEGKLDIVLQSIISNGIDVKVKIKQRKNRKAGFHRPTA